MMVEGSIFWDDKRGGGSLVYLTSAISGLRHSVAHYIHILHAVGGGGGESAGLHPIARPRLASVTYGGT